MSPSAPVLEVRDLSVPPPRRIEEGEGWLEAERLEVAPGQVVAVTAGSVEGRSALLHAILGLRRRRSGRCLVVGRDPRDHPLAVRRRTGFLARPYALPEWMDAEEAGDLAAALQPAWDPGLYTEALELLGVPEGRPGRFLSRSGRTGLALALALAHRPHLLLLDEPGEGLEPAERRELLLPVLQGARESGMAAVLALSDPTGLVEEIHDLAFLVGHQVQPPESVEAVTRRYHRAVLDYPEGLPSSFAFPHALRVELEPRRILMVLEGPEEMLRRDLASLGASSVFFQPLLAEEAVAEALGKLRRRQEAT